MERLHAPVSPHPGGDNPVDDDETFQAKVRMVAGFIDLFVARRMVSFRNFGYNTVQYTMFNLIKERRGGKGGRGGGERKGKRGIRDVEPNLRKLTMRRATNRSMKPATMRTLAWKASSSSTGVAAARIRGNCSVEPFHAL